MKTTIFIFASLLCFLALSFPAVGQLTFSGPVTFSGGNAGTVTITNIFNVTTNAPAMLFIWDNDGGNIDVDDGPFILAAAQVGLIKLLALTEEPSPYNGGSDTNAYQALLDTAASIGWNKIVVTNSPGLGSMWNVALQGTNANGTPKTIDETTPIDTWNSRTITNLVLTYGTTTNPVVIGDGGAMTTVASAYLMANAAGNGHEFASKCVVFDNIGGNTDNGYSLNGYNANQDMWAVYICFTRLRVVVTSESWNFCPDIAAICLALPTNAITSYITNQLLSPVYTTHGVPPRPAPMDSAASLLPALKMFYGFGGNFWSSVVQVKATGWTTANSEPLWNQQTLQSNLVLTATASTNAVWLANIGNDSTTTNGSPYSTEFYGNLIQQAMGVKTNSLNMSAP